MIKKCYKMWSLVNWKFKPSNRILSKLNRSDKATNTMSRYQAIIYIIIILSSLLESFFFMCHTVHTTSIPPLSHSLTHSYPLQVVRYVCYWLGYSGGPNHGLAILNQNTLW